MKRPVRETPVPVNGSRPLRVAIIALAVALFLGLLHGGQMYISAILSDRASSPWQTFIALPPWIMFALLAAPVYMVSRRYRLDLRAPARRWLLHGGFGVLFALTHLAALAALRVIVAGQPDQFGSFFATWAVFFFIPDFVVYWALVGVFHAFQYYHEYRAREKRALELEARLAEARLLALRSQLNPHFLFNTLNTVAGLAYQGRSTDVAEIVTRLGELLRRTLEEPEQQEVRLRDEVEMLDLYLDIQRIRFDDRVVINRELDPQTLEALVPSLLLQPLVENAVEHGIAKIPGPGEIRILSKRQDGRLVLEIWDTGPGVRDPGVLEKGVGIGISNTKARLEQLYGSDQSITFSHAAQSGRGITVSVSLPFRTEVESSSVANHSTDPTLAGNNPSASEGAS